MQNAGRILLMPKGDYAAGTTYEMLDLVNHGGASWVCKKSCTGQEPTDSNTTYWQRFGTAVNLSDYAPLERITNPKGWSVKNPIIHLGEISNLDTLDGLLTVSCVYSCISASSFYLGFYNNYSNGYGAQIKLSYWSGDVLSIRSQRDGVWTDWNEGVKKSDLANYLSLIGGTIGDGTKAYPLIIRGSSSYSLIDYMNDANSVRWGSLGFAGAEIPVFLTGDRKNTYTLLHTGNKPSGTYTGNGSATSRTISTGGLGGVVVITGNGGTTIATNDVSFCVTKDGITPLIGTCYHNPSSGGLILSTDNSYLNASGVTYTYRVL